MEKLEQQQGAEEVNSCYLGMAGHQSVDGEQSLAHHLFCIYTRWVYIHIWHKHIYVCIITIIFFPLLFLSYETVCILTHEFMPLGGGELTTGWC